MPLADLRTQIDALDSALLRLLNERADLVHEVGVIKKKDGLDIYAPEREESLLQGLLAKSEGRLPEKSIRAIYREIMSAALALEEDLKIAFLGPEGTWTHQAALDKFGHSVEYVGQPNLSDVFDQVVSKRADYGVVPIEDSTEGAVNHTLDMFADSPLKICAQILLPIENLLMANGPREEIRKLYSHPQVFSQCRDWINTTLPAVELVEVISTACAARIASEESGSAALGGKLVASLHGLQILESAIRDRATNTSRFLVLSHNTCPPTGDDQTSILCFGHFSLPVLLRSIQWLRDADISISQLISRAHPSKDGDTSLLLEVGAHQSDPAVIEATRELSFHWKNVRILGSYPRVNVQN